MKFKFLLILVVLAVANLATADEMHLIFTNGVAEKVIEPNMVIVRLESWSKAASAQKAQELQAIQFSKMKDSFEKFKIKKDDIQTESYNVYPEYVYDQKNQTNKVTGYRVSHSVVVTQRNVEKAGDFLDQLVTSRGDYVGVNVNNVSWDSDKKAEAELSVLNEAVKNARNRANELSKAAGVSIKAVHKIQHSSSAPPVVQPMYEKAAVMRMQSDAVAAPTELSSGQIKVRVEVQMEFEI